MADKLPCDWTLDDYQYQAGKTAIYPGRWGFFRYPPDTKPDPTGLLYAALGLAGEAGEIANEVKKILRDDNGQLTIDRRTKLIKELGDCLWYCAAVAEELNIDLGNVAAQNIAKLTRRQENGTLTGSGGDR